MPRNRSLLPHLELRPSGFFWRRRCARIFHGTETGWTQSRKISLCLSLRTHVLRDAKILARRLTEMSDLVFAADAEMTMAIAPEIQAGMLETLARFEIAAFEQARSMAPWRSPEAAALDLRREEALQMTLRQALCLGDREIVRHPLRHIAAQLGIELDETEEDWTALAYEATKVLLDVSHERARRSQGNYEQPSIAFRRVLRTEEPTSAWRSNTIGESTALPASLASATDLGARTAVIPLLATAAATTAAAVPVAAHRKTEPLLETVPASPQVMPTSEEVGADTVTYGGVTLPILQLFGVKVPAGMTAGQAQLARISMRPPNIHVAVEKLLEASQRALAKARGITLPEAIDLFFDLKNLGLPERLHPPSEKGQRRRREVREGELQQATACD